MTATPPKPMCQTWLTTGECPGRKNSSCPKTHDFAWLPLSGAPGVQEAFSGDNGTNRRTQLCGNWLRRACRNADDDCDFAHGVARLRTRQDGRCCWASQKQWSLCPGLLEHGKCALLAAAADGAPGRCDFAHGTNNLSMYNMDEETSKHVAFCPAWFIYGTCPRGKQCPFHHYCVGKDTPVDEKKIRMLRYAPPAVTPVSAPLQVPKKQVAAEPPKPPQISPSPSPAAETATVVVPPAVVDATPGNSDSDNLNRFNLSAEAPYIEGVLETFYFLACRQQQVLATRLVDAHFAPTSVITTQVKAMSPHIAATLTQRVDLFKRVVAFCAWALTNNRPDATNPFNAERVGEYYAGVMLMNVLLPASMLRPLPFGTDPASRTIGGAPITGINLATQKLGELDDAQVTWRAVNDAMGCLVHVLRVLI